MANTIRVLAVDDSALARNAYRLLLTPADGFELVATAPNADIARRKITRFDPDVVILDIEMPGENGLSLLKWIMETFPVPVVVSSSYSTRGAEQTMTALSLGAVEVICKGGTGGHEGWGQDFAATLAHAVRAASKVRRKARFTSRQAEPASTPSRPVQASRPIHHSGCVVIGASTGGTEALAALIPQLPADFPPTLIVQHMPPIYTRTFAERLNRLGVVTVSEAAHRQPLQAGDVVVAPGGKQLRVVNGRFGPETRVSDEGPYNRHAPSVDVLFHSAAKAYGRNSIGLLLTGMGKDGAQGLLEIRQCGGITLAQDEDTSVVYGMPFEALKCGAVDKGHPLSLMIPSLLRSLSQR